MIARTLALGGWVRPWLTVGALLAIPAALLVWVFLGPHRQRTTMTAAVMAVAVALIPVASAGATPSVARLAQIADAIGLPGEVVREVRIGSGMCRPACSEIRRTSMARGSAFAKFRRQAAGLLHANGFEVHEYGYLPGQPARIDAVRGRVLVSLELRPIGYDTRIAQIFLTKGPKPDTSVG